MQRGSVDFVKVDVEGAEVAVLAGASRLLTSPDRPVLLVEVEAEHQRRYEASPTDVPDLLGDAYRCFHLCWQHGVAEPFPDGACPSGRNLLCLPSDRVGEILGRVFES
jgi:hypothetical protein